MKEETYNLKIIIVSVIGIITISALFSAAYYMNNLIKYENFQKTITGLNDEQKCLHICGFQYPSNVYFDNYKYCVEKCDRISERQNTGGLRT